MESATGSSAAKRNGGVLMPPMASSSSSTSPLTSRKQWRVVPEHSMRNEDMEHSKLGQSDERVIYEVRHGREPVVVDFCTITTDTGLDNDLLRERLHSVSKQREESQQMEIELQAQVIARSEIMNMQTTFESQIKEHANAGFQLQEQLRKKEQRVHDLERKIEEKERELHSIRLDNEAVWAKQDLIKEQNKELQSYRRERDNSEVDRLQHVKKIHDLHEHIQEKESQFMELQEQQKIAQETILIKDEQLREAQAWITRAQEIDAMHSTTYHSLQTELRERTEQCNQLWLGCQRQFAEMERLHVGIHQLQLELADANEKNGVHSDESKTSSKNVSRAGNVKGSQMEVNGKKSPSAASESTQNGNSENLQSNAFDVNSLTQTDHVRGVAFAPSSLLGMSTYLPNGQLTVLHPFLMHQQGVPHSSHVTQSHFYLGPPMSATQQWPNLQAPTDAEKSPADVWLPHQTEHNMPRTDFHYGYETLLDRQVLRTNYFDNNVNPELDADSIIKIPNENGQVHGLIAKGHHNNDQSQKQNLQQISSLFNGIIGLNPVEHVNEPEEKKSNPVNNDGPVNNKTGVEYSSFAVDASVTANPTHPVIFSETTDIAPSGGSSVTLVSTGLKSDAVGKYVENYLLDERALLACMARTIGSGSRIRISSTLPNRLGRMLAPLHWHDYRKKYGNLDEFVASHPDLFLVEGDYIMLREGAQEIIAATAAVAKVAASVTIAPSSALLPTVAVTPMATECHQPANSDEGSVNASHHHPQFSTMQNQNINGGYFQVGGGTSSISKPKDRIEQNGYKTRPDRLLSAVNGTRNSEKIEFSQSNVASFHGRSGTNITGRTIGAAPGTTR